MTSEKAPRHAFVGRELLDAVNGAAVQSICAVRLGLQTDTDVLDGSGENGVGDTGETTSKIVLAIGKGRVGVFLLVELFQTSTGFMESAELNTDLVSVRSWTVV